MRQTGSLMVDVCIRYAASELSKPVVVKQKDKVAFTLGIINICLTELILLTMPQYLHLWYLVWLLPLMIWR